MTLPSILRSRVALAALLACAAAAHAERVDVTVDAAMPWVGFVNLFERPAGAADRGARVDGFFLNTDLAALPASIAGSQAMLAPNGTLGGAPRDGTDWWIADGKGGHLPNRVIEANVYVDTGFSGVALGGKTVRFSGTTLASSLAAPYVAYAFIRDFLPGYQSGYTESSVALVAGQAFELTLDTVLGHPVQYGFALVGPNADPAALGSLGSITISAVPEPATPAMLLLGAAALLGWMRRQR
ncbi:PEP-CTERM sorting domain-containing protein [Pseudaquabacterium pictum]|uniref:Ice-binding protein C-terminal domain-containing protein n=1 Tax=Pseudaquabacterium pictum TaxID=2315236 RepID=A0A480AXR8_9BURK|nr:PEP-CTERM sorting domain-containing protein [Rubrivivax pictus]GCL66153.1 hypothetical protein AQPW35_52340 [Rubrivivax pictus]